MVAYSFKPFFVPQILAGIKRQTVRTDRRRHARPGEPIQLFTAMRTKHCRKILDRDPTCIEVLPIVIVTSGLLDCGIAGIEVDGTTLHRDQIEEFARADGFAPEHVNGLTPDLVGTTARANMGAFWRANHPADRFEGVLIKWETEAR
ncbi:ASCH domain-containing protein [Ensifer aridi]|uniref:ASCH domain-containing protein n=1 Tax=Ensifer aridi TaxID=1708715 RepID=UPI000A0F7B02|nr:ASCH domain-containing protein [Ensifer aridi]